MYIQEGQTIIIEGKQRQGKTLLAANLCEAEHLKGRKIYSNIGLAFPHEKIRLRDLDLGADDYQEKFMGSVIFIDEFNMLFGNREAQSKVNKKFSNVLLQTKKIGVDLIGTTHSLDYLDKRFRENFDVIIRTNVYPVIRKPGEPPEVLNLQLEAGPAQPYFMVHDQVKLTPSMFACYDTTETIDPLEGCKP